MTLILTSASKLYTPVVLDMMPPFIYLMFYQLSLHSLADSQTETIISIMLMGHIHETQPPSRTHVRPRGQTAGSEALRTHGLESRLSF